MTRRPSDLARSDHRLHGLEDRILARLGDEETLIALAVAPQSIAPWQ